MSYTPMLSGMAVDLLNPAPAEINLVDMSTGLSRIVRYLGQTPEPYSVAEHCVVMAEQAPRLAAIHFLLHDAAEYVLGDIAHPVKQLFPGYQDLEDGVMAAIYSELRIEEPDGDLKALIHHYDMRMRSTEKLCFGIDPDREWIECRSAPAFPVRLHCWDHQTAARKWLAMFSDLYADYAKRRQAAETNRFNVQHIGQR